MTSPDIDRGWAFAVLASDFLSKFLILGFMYSSSVFYVIFLEEFEGTPTTTAWTVAISCFTISYFSIVANIVTKFVGRRKTIIIGVVLSSAGILLTSFAKSLLAVTLMFGVVLGIGYSLVILQAYDMIALYFVKYRKLAYVTGSSGNSLGLFAIPLLITALSDHYHWRGAMLIFTGINLNLLLAAAVFMNPRTATKELEKATEELLQTSAEETKKISHCQRVLRYLSDCVSLVKQADYALFLVSYVFYGVGLGAFSTHLSNLAIVRGYNFSQAAWLPSFVGIMGAVGRLFVIILAQVLSLSIVGIYVVFLMIISIALGVFAFTTSYTIMLVCSGVIGFFHSVSSIYAEMIIRLIGVKNVTTGVSHTYLLSGVGIMMGGPLAAWIFEKDPTYQSSFVFIAVAYFLASSLNLRFWIKDLRRSRGGKQVNDQIEKKELRS